MKAEAQLIKEETDKEIQLTNSIKMMSQLYIDKHTLNNLDDSQVLMKVTCIPTYFNPKIPQSHQIYEAILSRDSTSGAYALKKISPSLPQIENIYKIESLLPDP